jgi:hypothetical protein
MFKSNAEGKMREYTIGSFCDGKADSLWPAVGDADNDGKNEIVIATGSGNRKLAGSSYVVVIKANKEN